MKRAKQRRRPVDLEAMGRKFVAAWTKAATSWDGYLEHGQVAHPNYMDGVTDLPNAADTDENL